MRHVFPVVVSLAALVAAIVWVASTSNLAPLADAVAKLSWFTSAMVFALFIVATLLSSLRLWLIARDVGSPISGRDATAALSFGTLAGVVFFQIMGQTIARSALLAKRGTPVAATLVISAYERVIAVFVSLLLGALGACYLFGKLSFDVSQGGGELLKIIAAGFFAILAGAYLGWGRYAARQLRATLSRQFWHRATRSLAMSVAIQLCTMTAYVLAALALEPNLRIIDVAAASAVVMLVSSLPISLAGWGIREISAVLALGAIGIPGEKALVVALLIGAMSLAALVLVMAVTFASGRTRQIGEGTAIGTFQQPDFATALAWLIPVATATAVFFQIHIPTAAGTKLNVNLADPFVVTAASLFVLGSIRTRTWPQWRLQGLNTHIVLVTLVMTLSLLIGWMSFGLTAWAFTSKYLGWFVLLSYGATGALLVTVAGQTGCRVLLRTFIAAGIAICGLEIVLLELRNLGLPIDVNIAAIRASGLAANPNAFAMQIVLVACATLVAIRSQRLMAVLLAIAMTAIWLTGSRAGLGAAAVVLAAAAIVRPALRRSILYALLLSVGILFLLEAAIAVRMQIAHGPFTILSDLESVGHFGPIVVETPKSDMERWQTILGGLSLFSAHPLLGAGLGAFAESWRLEHGQVQVIHSTPLWLLAEFGIFGTAIIILPFLRIVVHSLAHAIKGQPMAILAFLSCLAFATMASMHEMLYQRPFWLLLGASLALGHHAVPWPEMSFVRNRLKFAPQLSARTANAAVALPIINQTVPPH